MWQSSGTYTGITLRNQNYMCEEIKSSLNLQTTPYHLIRNSFSSHFLPKDMKIKIQRTISLHFVLYGCETLSVKLREEHKLKMFENWVLRNIFGPKMEDVTGLWRKLRREQLHGLYSSPNIIQVVKLRRMRWVGHVAHRVEKQKCILGFDTERRPLGRPRHW
jgi:hypothetical protein